MMKDLRSHKVHQASANRKMSKFVWESISVTEKGQIAKDKGGKHPISLLIFLLIESVV